MSNDVVEREDTVKYILKLDILDSSLWKREDNIDTSISAQLKVPKLKKLPQKAVQLSRFHKEIGNFLSSLVTKIC